MTEREIVQFIRKDSHVKQSHLQKKKYLCLKKWIFKESKNQFPFNTLVEPMGSTPTTPELYIFIKYNTYFPFGQNSKKKKQNMKP